ncbi:polymeric immunoglobulin receptor-like [Ptychodera flava]|uniref:polymeric immunoglobulin receptor-like n=1 Tax=Ptychodera flava TaxID=63121 RepID=UPI003969D889
MASRLVSTFLVLALLSSSPLVESVVTLIREPSNTTAYVDETVILACEVDGLLEDHSLVWMKGDHVISTDGVVSSNYSGSSLVVTMDRERGEYNIQITRAQVEDSGVYRCGIEDSNGNRVTSDGGTLTVLRYFEHHPNNIGVYKGETALLSCIVNTIKGSSVSLVWAKGSQIIATNDTIDDVDDLSDRSEIVGDFTVGIYNISIRNVTTVDNGFYQCGVELNDGSVRWSLPGRLTVSERENLLPIEKSTYVGDSTVLPCDVVTYETRQTLVWQKDNHTVTWNEFISDNYNRSRVVPRKDSDSYNLTFTFVEQTDSGKYECGEEFDNGVYHWLAAFQLNVVATEFTRQSTVSLGSGELITNRSSYVSSSTAETDHTTRRRVTVKVPSTGNDFWIVIVVIVIGVLVAVVLVIICVLSLTGANRRRKEKNADEYSPQDTTLENLQLRLKEEGYENPVLLDDDEMADSFQKEGGDSQNRRNGKGQGKVTESASVMDELPPGIERNGRDSWKAADSVSPNDHHNQRTETADSSETIIECEFKPGDDDGQMTGGNRDVTMTTSSAGAPDINSKTKAEDEIDVIKSMDDVLEQ